MIYNRLLSKPKGRLLIGYIQISFLILYIILKVNECGVYEKLYEFFVPNDLSLYTKEYKKSVYDVSMFFDVLALIFSITYAVRGLHKVNTWQLTGHRDLEMFRTSFWSSITSLSWWIEYINTPRNRNDVSRMNSKDNINSVLGYVKSKNAFSSREKNAETYASINNVSMMDKKTRDYVNGRLSWMSREQGYEYIKGLNKKED